MGKSTINDDFPVRDVKEPEGNHQEWGFIIDLGKL